MTDSKENIERLLGKFLAGQTTESQEQMLADFFATAENIPPQWQAYQRMFQSFLTDAYDLSDEALDDLLTPAAPSRRPRLLRKIAAILLAVSLLTGLGYAAIHVPLLQRGHTEEAQPAPHAEIKTVGDSIVLFRDTRLDSIMAQVGQHYQVDIQFADDSTRAIRLLFKWNKKHTLHQFVQRMNGFERIHVDHSENGLKVQQTTNR